VFSQLATQGFAVAIAIVYAAACTLVLVVVIDRVLGFRLDPAREMAGMDHALHGESGYGMLNLD
jgi:Amt family ammonium transporter